MWIQGLYDGFVIMLNKARSAFSEFYNEYYGIPIETPRDAQKLTQFGKLRFDWSIKRSPERPTQYNLFRCSSVEMNIGILIRLSYVHHGCLFVLILVFSNGSVLSWVWHYIRVTVLLYNWLKDSKNMTDGCCFLIIYWICIIIYMYCSGKLI